MYQEYSFIFALLGYIAGTVPIYLLAKKAEYDYAFFAFIPIANFVLLCNVGGLSGWVTLLLLIPIVNIIVGLIITFKFYASFESGIGVFICIILFGLLSIGIPFINILSIVAIWWLALSSREYIGDLYLKY